MDSVSSGGGRLQINHAVLAGDREVSAKPVASRPPLSLEQQLLRDLIFNAKIPALSNWDAFVRILEVSVYKI